MILGVGVLIYVGFVYFLVAHDSIGATATGALFVLYAAEHIGNFINRSEMKIAQDMRAKVNLPFLSIGVPSIIIGITWCIQIAIT